MWWIALSLALEPFDAAEPAAMPPLFRVADPTWPGAVATTPDAALLEAPPPPGVPYQQEPDVRLDGWPAIQAVEVMNADLWHAHGWTGAGVKVAVFDLGWFGAEADVDVLGDVETADCFLHASCELAMDTLRARYPIEEGQHGVACAHAVRSVAPDAELHLVRVNALASLENAVTWAVRNEIDVISMSMSFFNASFYDGTGPYADLLAELGAGGVQLVSSAGNSARQHWQAPWRDLDLDGRLDGDGDNAVLLELAGGGRRTVYVTWSEFGSCGDSDLDVVVLDPDGFIVGRSFTEQSAEGDTCSPVERVGVNTTVDGVYRLEVVAKRVAPAGLLVDVMTQSGAVVNAMPAGSIVDPGVHPGTFTVGAVDAEGYLTNPVEGFSSQGPVRSGALKPDVAGPDGLDSAVFGQRGFFGTSASTPAVAGALALVLSRYPELTPAEGAKRLQTWAWNPERSGAWDPAWGAGKVRLPEPLEGSWGCARDRDGLGGVGLLLLWWGRRRANATRGCTARAT